MDAVLLAKVSHAAAGNHKWPFSNLPDFAVRATDTRRLSKTDVMTLYPIVNNDDRVATQNDGWVKEIIEVQSSDPHYHGPLLWGYVTAEYIHDAYSQVQATHEFYQPSWQSSPQV